MSVNNKLSSNVILDTEKFNCRICLSNGKTNTIKQYYVNLDTTVNMCSICQSTFLMQNLVVVNQDPRTPVSSKSWKKMSLLPYLLKEEVSGNLTQGDAMNLLENAFEGYKKSLAREEEDLDDFFTLASELLPNHVSCKPTAQSRDKQALALSKLSNGTRGINRLDGEEVFYFSNGLKLPKQEITDEDIEAAISALSCENSPSMNFEEFPDIDSFLDYSSQLSKTVPILSDETLLSPIYLDSIKKFNDETLQKLNEDQHETGIKISVDFAALEKVLAPPNPSDSEPQENPNQTRITRKLGRFLSKSNFRASDMLLKTQQLHLWKENSAEEASLTQLHNNLRKVETKCKSAFEDNLKTTFPVQSNSCITKTNINSNSSSSKALAKSNSSSTNVSEFYDVQNSNGNGAVCSFGSKTYGPKEGLKMFQGFQFTEFEGVTRKKLKLKPKKKQIPKAKTGPIALLERLKAAS